MAFDGAAFQTGSGGLAPTGITDLVIGTVGTVLLLWMGWVAISAFRAWKQGDADFYDFLWAVIRSGLVTVFLGFYIR